MTLKISFQGEPGAYSEAAALEYFKNGIETVPCLSFDHIFKNVINKTTEFGLIPIENSLAGSIHRNYDLMLRHNLHIIGEYHLRVSHCLMALPGVELQAIRKVHSHPQALAQCEGSLTRLGLEPVIEADTAGSAKLIRDKGDLSAGVLASKRAAEVYGLNILAENMEDSPANFTRFLILSKNSLGLNPPIDPDEYKTSIVFSLNNKPGVLFKALSVFALREIDLTKIESRPLPGQPWEYLFYIDFIGHAQSEVCHRALDHLAELTTFQRILGSYPKHKIEYTK